MLSSGSSGSTMMLALIIYVLLTMLALYDKYMVKHKIEVFCCSNLPNSLRIIADERSGQPHLHKIIAAAPIILASTALPRIARASPFGVDISRRLTQSSFHR